MTKRLRELWLDTAGQDSAEYGLLLALIALVTVAAITGIATVDQSSVVQRG